MRRPILFSEFLNSYNIPNSANRFPTLHEPLHHTKRLYYKLFQSDKSNEQQITLFCTAKSFYCSKPKLIIIIGLKSA